MSVNRAKKIDDVRLKIELVTLLHEVMNTFYGWVNSPALDESKAAVQVKSLEGGCDEKSNCFHHDPISHGGDLQRARFLRSRLRDRVGAKFAKYVSVGP